MNFQIIQGDLLDQDVDVIVNAWNRNIIPWWLLLPQGVSGAIKRRGGTGPFKELAKHGSIPLGGAVLTSAGRLPFKGIIHVAGINMLWRASEWSIRQCVQNAMALAHEKGFHSIAFPLIGAGSGGFNQERAKAIMEDELGKLDYPLDVRLVVSRSRWISQQCKDDAHGFRFSWELFAVYLRLGRPKNPCAVSSFRPFPDLLKEGLSLNQLEMEILGRSG